MDECLIFTPDNEPYLGRRPLHVFDVTIVAIIQTSTRVAKWTHTSSARTDLQKAAIVTIPQVISLALAIRELLRQGYLFPAKVMVRSLVERAVTTMYLSEDPDAVVEWHLGWRHGKRPNLATMMDYIAKGRFVGQFPPNVGRLMTKPLNSLTHGSPESADWNAINLDEQRLGFGVSKNLSDPGLCDEICDDVIPWLVVIGGMMSKIFPDAAQVNNLKTQ